MVPKRKPRQVHLTQDDLPVAPPVQTEPAKKPEGQICNLSEVSIPATKNPCGEIFLGDLGDAPDPPLPGVVIHGIAAQQLSPAQQSTFEEFLQGSGPAKEILFPMMGSGGDESMNHIASQLQVQKTGPSSGTAPWVGFADADANVMTDYIAQLAYALQNEELKPDGPGFILHLNQEGFRVSFSHYSAPLHLELLHPKGVKRVGGAAVCDITYWVISSMKGHKTIRAVMPCCRVSGFRGLPVAGITFKSVRRALAMLKGICPCGRSFHTAARGDDADPDQLVKPIGQPCNSKGDLFNTMADQVDLGSWATKPQATQASKDNDELFPS